MSHDEMKVLLVGPCPPPHGGISVHVDTARRLLRRAGARCRVLDVGGHRAPGERSTIRSRLRLLATVRELTGRGWTLHLHTNGHNPKSWLVVLLCGLAGRRAPGKVLTLHSGMVPDYLSTGPARRRWLARIALRGFDRVVCVNDEIRTTLTKLGAAGSILTTLPAYLPAPQSAEIPPDSLGDWLESHDPVLVATLFFRPEYGFDLLLDAVSRLEPLHPSLGCLVLGDGDGAEAARKLLETRGLGERVFLAGDVSHGLCLELLSRCDLFVRPTLVDGDALSVREALSLGLPVVASDTGNRPRGVVLFPPGGVLELTERIQDALGPALARDRILAGESSENHRGLETLLDTYRLAGAGEATCH